MLDSTKSSDEKASFGNVGIPATSRAGITSQAAANATRFISGKLLEWGVEERGAYRIFNFSLRADRFWNNECFSLRFFFVFACQLTRYSPRRCRGQDRNKFHQDILRIFNRLSKHLVVSVLFFNTLLGRAYTLALS